MHTAAAKKMETALTQIDKAIAILSSLELHYIVDDLRAASEKIEDELMEEIGSNE